MAGAAARERAVDSWSDSRSAVADESRNGSADRVNLLVGVVVMHRRPHQRGDPACVHIEAGPRCIAHGDIDPLPGEGSFDRSGGEATAQKAPDAAPGSSLVTHLHARNPGELRAQAPPISASRAV